MAVRTVDAPGFLLQKSPRMYVVSLLGRWLLKRTTPSWRIDDPETGFQRVVRERRAREIALAVLEQQRTFPNAIVLATDKPAFTETDGIVKIPSDTRFLVVDGQHRLWAQSFADFKAQYACMIHTGLTEVDMARLFLEINDTQKRVPSSLRWDLVRLVRPDDDPHAIGAAELVKELVEDDESPLYQRIDLTGEQPEITLKQGSLAPELKKLLSQRSPLHDLSFNDQHMLIQRYLIALRDLDGDKWGTGESKIYKARVLRAFIRLLAEITRRSGKNPVELNISDFSRCLSRIDYQSLDPEQIRAVQGSAGIKAIYEQIKKQAFST